MIRLIVFLLMVCSVTILAQETPMRDPFSPYTSGSGAIPQSSNDVYVVPMIKLTGIIAGSEKAYAVLVFKGQRKVVSLGQTIGQYEVEVVTDDSVKLKGPDKTFILKIGQEIRI